MFYLEENDRWSYIKDNSKSNKIFVYIDDAFRNLEKNNISLKGALPIGFYTTLHIEASKFSSLIDEIDKLQYSQTESDDVKKTYGFAKYLRDSFPHATYVGFTGTPVDATLRVFGEVVVKYTMKQALDDGATVGIARLPGPREVQLDEKIAAACDEYYRLQAEAGANEYQIEKSKKDMTNLKIILGNPDRLDVVVKHFIWHYEKRLEEHATVLKTTVMLLLRHSKVDAEYKDALKKEMLFFSNVDTVDPTAIKWSSIRFQRNSQTYHMLISLCQLILQGMLLTTDSGEYKLASFIDEQRMSRLYEKFILEYYIKEYPAISASASQIPWALDDGDGTMLPVMQSDIMLSHKEKVLIIDAKYYTHTTQVQYDIHTLHSGNLYQIFTYVKNKEAELAGKPHEVSGMLLYARTDETVQPDNVYQMSGNKISVKTLDLNCEFSEIVEQLNCIAEEQFGKTIKKRCNAL